MPELSVQAASAVAAAALGLLSHLAYFIHGEHHVYTVQYVQMMFFTPCLAFIGLSRFGPFSSDEALSLLGSTVVAYLGALYTSIVIYRLFFHPLRNFPGPIGLRVTKFWHVAQISKRDNYRFLSALLDKYGPIVRTGPNELTIRDGPAMALVHGPRSKCTKGPSYDLTLPLMSLHQSRDRVEHDKRRKTWDRGFSTKALRGYESRILKYKKMLIEQIERFSGQPLDATKWFNYFSFDVMGDLAFGKSFDMLHTGEKHFAINLLHTGQEGIGILGPTPWLMYLMTRTPIVSKGYWTFVNWCEQQVEERSKMEVSDPDIMSWLLKGETMSPDPEVNRNWLAGDSRLIIVAGSDTTAATLTHVFYHLASDPSQVQKLRDELAGLSEEDFTDANLRDLNHINGCIDEALRLHPPVPAGVARLTPPEGLQVRDTHIPGGVSVVIQTSSVQRSPECFLHPNEFIPERWYSKPEMVIEPNAFAPFSMGRYGCIGKNLAYIEMRTVIATLITKFDVSFGPGEDGSKLLNDAKDCFTMVLAPLNLKFTPCSKT